MTNNMDTQREYGIDGAKESTLYKINKEYTFLEFKDIVTRLAASGKSSGEENVERIEATKINSQRINRIYKTFVPGDKTKDILSKLKHDWDWLLLLESWCGDGAQLSSIIARIAELNMHIHLKIIFRDEHEHIMNMHLTNGSKSIPKLICLDSSSKKYIGEWGPRPDAISEKAKEFKANNPTVPHEEFIKNLHLWYAQDKGISFENEFTGLIEKWNEL